MKNTSVYIKKICSVFFLIFMITHQASATEFTFTGSGSFTDESLWSPFYPTGQIGVGDTVIISTGAICTIPAGTFIFIQGGLVNNGNLTSNTTFGAFRDGSIINNGYLHVFASIDNLGNIFNNGTIEAEGTFSTQGEGTIDNSSGSTIINNATFVASSSEGIQFNFEGTFKGTGSIFVQDYLNLGLIAPGFSPGVLTFKNNLALGSSGVLEIEITGMGGAGAMDGHDQIIIEKPGGVGDLSIDGTLKVVLLDGFTPEVGDQWVIATGNTSGAFSALDLPNGLLWEVDIQPDKIILIVTDASLPVDLTNFNAIQRKSSVLLSWSTTSEDQNGTWVIDRLDAQNRWQNLGELPGSGNSSTINNYRFKDSNPRTGLNYYRLTQMDFDGRQNYSPTVTVHFIKEQFEISIYPNPVEETVHFSRSISNVLVYNSLGQCVFDREVAAQSLDLGHLQAGIYTLKFKLEDEGYSRLLSIK